MSIRNQYKQSGYVLMITLIFVLVLSLLVVAMTEATITAIKSETGMQQYQQLFYRAESGVLQMEQRLLGRYISLPSSSIALQTDVEHVDIDSCGNKIVDIVAMATWRSERFVLRSREIFARVPLAKKCRKIPLQKRLWWEENIQ